MASIDNALTYAEKEGGSAFERFRKRFALMQERLSACKCLRFLPADPKKQDVGKLIISVKGVLFGGIPFDGKKLYDILREEYHLQPEMAAGSYVLAMFTVGDSEEGYSRMEQALSEIDGRLRLQTGEEETDIFLNRPQKTDGSVMPLAAWEMEAERVDLSDSVGRYAGDFVNLYPPGVPVLVPGEPITEAVRKSLQDCLKQGLTVQGIEKQGGRMLIKVLRDPTER